MNPTTTPDIGQTISFDGTSSGGDSYTWAIDGTAVRSGTIGDGGLAFDTSFASAGQRDVQLTLSHSPDCDPFVDPDCDPTPSTDTETKTVAVQDPPPNASNDSYSTDENSSLNGDVLSNDSDPDGDALSASLVNGPSKGQLSFSSDGTFTFDPNGHFESLAVTESETVSFDYEASDGDGGSDQATVSITVHGKNDPVSASNDSYSTDENSNLSGNVLNNDSDPDGDNLSASVVNGISEGELTFSGDGSFTFTPNGEFDDLAAGESKTVTFDYEATDGNGSTDQATASIQVHGKNSPVTASSDSYSTDENTTQSGNVLDNDSDVDGDNLSASKVSDPSKGQIASFNSDGSFTFTPNGEFDELAVGESQTVTFDYEATDGNGSSDQATVSITVHGKNNAVSASNDSYSTGENSSQSGNVLDNDSDIDGDNLTASKVSNPAKGSISLNSDGSFTFDPSGEFDGLSSGESETVSFDYKASDGNGSSDKATATITVNGKNDPVTASDDAYSVQEGEAFVASAPGVLENDSDPDDTPTASKVNTPSKGTVSSFNSDGSFTFKTNGDFTSLGPGESEIVSFDYEAADGNGSTDQATVSIEVQGVNSAPVANSDTGYTTKEDQALEVTTAANGLLDNDSDPEGDNLTATTVTTSPQNGSVTSLNGDGTFTYDPDNDFNGSDTFTYEVSDGNKTATATVSLRVTRRPDIGFTDGTSYTPPSPTPGTDGNPIGRFTLTADETTPDGSKPILTEITITDRSAPEPSGIKALELWRSTDGSFSAASDSRIATKFYLGSSFPGSATLTGLDLSIPSSGATHVFVVVDLKSSAGGEFAPVIRDEGEITFSDGTLSSINGSDGTTLTDAPLSSSGTTLPVELVAFEGTRAVEGVRLNWTTASETDNAAFRIQRRTEGVRAAPKATSAESARFKKNTSTASGDWETIGTVPGSGTTSEPQTYRFTDADLPYEADTLAYRLKQIDTDGGSSVTTPVLVGRSTSSVELLGVAPNPARSRVLVRYAVPERTETTVRLYDVLGREVRTLTRGRVQGRKKVQIDVSDLPSGLYLLRLRAGQSTKTERVTVVQ